MWLKVDDGLWHHPKVMTMRNAPLGMWLRAGAWAAHHLTDGRIPADMLHMFVPEPKGAIADCADVLVRRGLWEPDGDGWVFHDWTDYQPTADEVRKQRAASAERQRRARTNHLKLIENEQGPQQ